jgi:hypothetical protein
MNMKSRLINTLVLLIVLTLVITFMKSFWFICYLEDLNDFPIVVSFSNLHLTENLKLAKEVLNAILGVYCVSHTESERMSIGSLVDLGNRLMDHLFYEYTNSYLFNAMAKYGLAVFTVSIL